MEIVKRQFNDKKGNPVFIKEVVDTADVATIDGKVYRRKKKDGELESEDFFETDEPSPFQGLGRNRVMQPRLP